MQWQWPQGEFDAIICIFIQFASPAERKQLFDGFRTALKPGGVVLMEGYGVKQLQYSSGGPGKLENLYTVDMLRECLARHAADHGDDAFPQQRMRDLLDLLEA